MSRLFAFVCWSVVDSLLVVLNVGADAAAGPGAVVATDLLNCFVYTSLNRFEGRNMAA